MDQENKKKDLGVVDALLDEIQKSYDPTNLALCDDLKYLQWQICVRKFHEEMQSKLGDRNYDHITYRMMLRKINPLFLKVGYALYGEPCKQGNELYDKEQTISINDICTKIIEKSKKFNANGSIYLSILFIPCYRSNENDTQEMNVLFIVGKENSTDMRIILNKNNNIRVYKSWQKFKNDNPFSKCSYALPKDGKYQAGIDGSPLLEFKRSKGETLVTKAGTAFGNANTGITVVAAAFGIATIFVPLLAPVAAGAAAVSSVARVKKRNSEKALDEEEKRKSDSANDKIGRSISLHETNNAPSRMSLSTVTALKATNAEADVELLLTFNKLVEQILDFKFSDDNVSKKHKELLEKTMFLIHHSFLETLEFTHRAQFTSYILFFFNVHIINHKAYVEKFLEKFKETIAHILLAKTKSEVNDRQECQPIQYLKLEKCDEADVMIDALMEEITKVDFQMSDTEIQDTTLKLFGIQTSDQNSEGTESNEETSDDDQQKTSTSIAQNEILHHPTENGIDKRHVEWDAEHEVYVHLRKPTQKKSNTIDTKARQNLDNIDCSTENAIDESMFERDTEQEVNEVAQKSYLNNWGVKCVVAGVCVAGLFVAVKYLNRSS